MIISARWMVAVALAMAAGFLFAANPNDESPDMGPDIVILDELEDIYEPVPFDHLSHAEMAEMWNGCETCHHYSPHPSDGLSTATAMNGTKRQEDAAVIPACKSCHKIGADDADIRMPGLKGAYHRQCLNCHQEWMHENACVICHEAKEGKDPAQSAPTPGDIVGRMHPPIPEPEQVHYKTRFTPADGGNVLFRHKDHTAKFGIRCVDCHRRDSCAHCHSPEGDVNATMPLNPGMTWEESHGPCMACHQGDRCQECHYRDEGTPPSPFNHRMTGQLLDDDHDELLCKECHADRRFSATPTCGDSSCHEQVIVYPEQLPGPVVETVAEETGVVELPAGGAVQ